MNKFITGLSILLLSTNFALASNCASLYPNNQEIAIFNTTELCSSFYVVRFDEIRNVPVISAEVLQPEFTHTKRLNQFHPDTRLNENTRAENSDYAHSGFDRGHLTPAENSINPIQMYDTFLLSNMAPQYPTCNRLAWKNLEEKIHKQVVATGKPVHVITGLIFNNYNTTIGKHHIPVPSKYYKVIYFDGTGIDAYYAENINNCSVNTIDISNLEKEIGFKLH